MTVNYLKYPLKNGYIHHWLVAGPQATPIPVLERSKEDGTVNLVSLARQFRREQADLSEPPVDRGESEIGGEKITWNYVRCQEDHFVDVSDYYSTWQHLHTWAYTEISSPSPIPVTIVLTTLGPADVWLNGKLIHRREIFSRVPSNTNFQTSLERENTLLVRFDQVAVRECENVMALQIVDFPSVEDEQGISVTIPTNARFPLRQQALEQNLEMAYLEEVVNHRGTHINLRWAEDTKEGVAYAFKVKDALKYVYVDGNWRTDPAKPFDVGHFGRLRERPYFVTLEAPLKEFFEHNLRYQRALPIHVLDDTYSSAPYHDLAQRRQEALESAMKFENNLFAEIAKMELNRWSDLNPSPMLQAIDQVNLRKDDSDISMVGLMGILYRYKDNPAFPKNLERPIEECILNFKYWLDEPGEDALDFTSESHTILFHTCEILAGQLYPERIFTNSRQTGAWHREKGEGLAQDWMRRHGSSGFLEWNSNCYYEQVILSLSYLTSLAQDDTVHELAAVLLDKILFMLAVNSFKGSFGSSHGRTHATMIKSAQLEATSGISRLLWGLGVFNHHIQGTVSLACSDYEYPAFFADIATDLAEEMWGKERHPSIPPGGGASSSGEGEVNTVTYKTPDTMLSSAQDYHPGGRGSQEHIWQATLGPDAVVFTSHPACMSEGEAHHPGFWLGNAVLPRVAQWKDVLFAVYNIPDHDWLGFTHAYFPIYAFDEHAFQAGWAFARKGKGYLALTAARGFELIKRGPDGYRELRSFGHQNVWVCQMGREAKDGAFIDFQNSILKLPLNFQDLAVQMTGLRGEDLAFGWQGPLTIHGTEQPISGFKHIENPYCTADPHASHLDISYGGFLLRLNFE